MDSEAVRETFLTFFERHDHLRIAGSGVVPVNDPTLLYINSGMAPLKPYFTGQEKPPSPRLCNVQPCVRTIDIDDVGDRHHLTYFEMLGSWSIGDYFKDGAVELAYDLLTNGFGFDPSRLYVTIFAGDDEMGVPADEQSAAAWERVGIARDHIVALPAEDNFWGPAGDSGPCGPCTEVFLDTGDEYGEAYRPGGHFDTSSRYIEIWNAGVFMQFDKGLDGVFRPLPIESVDTGSGLERVTLALRGLDNVYETDLLAPVVDVVQQQFGETGEILPHHRLLTDHVRAATAILAEGIEPTNEGRGYIPRRLIRKCVTTAMSHGIERLEFEPVVDAVVDRLGAHHPHLVERKGAVLASLERESHAFATAVGRGIERLEAVVAEKQQVTGADAFYLFATYGLPVEITRDLATARGVDIDVEGFREEFHRHQDISRATGFSSGSRRLRTDDALPAGLSSTAATEFLGYESLEARGRVVAVFVEGEQAERAVEGDEVDLLLDRTPFYPEGGGQVGDRGRWSSATAEGRVADTVSHESGRYIHRATVDQGSLAPGDELRLAVDEYARARTAANHTATHLLNAAVRKVLGPHAEQAGSLVEPERLRFDYTHPQPTTPEELEELERLVNSWILTDSSLRVDVMDPERAISTGALTLPGETYDDDVRVVTFGNFSKELCGGTHVERTSVVGTFRILGEGSVSAGVRRINAVTREGAVEHGLEQARTIRETAAILRSSAGDLPSAAQRLVSKKADRGEGSSAATITREERLDGRRVLVGHGGSDAKRLRGEAIGVAKERDAVVLLTVADEDKLSAALAVPPGQTDTLDAGDLVKRLLEPLGGSGGGKPDVGQGGLRSVPEDADLGDLLLSLLR